MVAYSKDKKVISYSILDMVNTCARKYELEVKLGLKGYDSNINFAYGHALGEGIQSLLNMEGLNTAILKATIAWFKDGPITLEEHEKGKSIWHAIEMIERFATLLKFKNNPFSDYEVAYFDINGVSKPAIELNFSVACPHNWFYEGHIDIVLRKKGTNIYIILELKTNNSTNLNEIIYKNSLQALGYGLVLDAATKAAQLESTYSVFYFVVQPKLLTFQPFSFNKSYRQKVEFVKTLLVEVERLEMYGQMDFYPKNGSACFNYGKPCKFGSVCGMTNETLLQMYLPEDRYPDMGKPDFEFNLEDLIAAIS